MKTTLSVFSLFTVIAVPATLLLETVGFELSSSVNAEGVFGLFFVSLLALIALSDYARGRQPAALVSAIPAKAAHPLAA